MRLRVPPPPNYESLDLWFLGDRKFRNSLTGVPLKSVQFLVKIGPTGGWPGNPWFTLYFLEK